MNGSPSALAVLLTAALTCSVILAPPVAATEQAVVTVTSTIQAAVDAAPPGSTVVIPPGVYHESVSIHTDRLTLRAAPGAVLDGTGLAGPDGLRVVAPSGARLTGFELDGLTVQNFTRDGVFLRDVDTYRITGTVTRNDLDYGIFPVRTNHGRVDHTTSSGSLDTGLYIGQSVDIELDHNVATGHTIGIDIEASDHVDLHHNLATRNAIGAVAQVVPGLSRTTTQDTVIDHNIFTGNNAANPSTDPNDFLTRLPNGLGLLIVATDHTTTKHNIITDNQTAGMAVVQLPPDIAALDPRVNPYPTNLAVTNNIITRNAFHPDPTNTGPAADIVWDGSGTGNCWSRNITGSTAPTTLPTC